MRRRLCSALWIVLSGLALTSASVREVEDPKSTNWPRFRGPAGLGHAEDPGFPSEFELKDAAWKINLSGVGHSSPVVWEDGVYITSEAEGGTRLITRFQLSDGKPVWTHIDQFEAHRQHDLNSFAAATPALDEHGVYLVWTDGEKLVGLALDHEGETLWERELGPYRAQHGSGASPVVHDGVLLVVGDHEIEEETSYLLGLDCKTGEEVWRRERTSARASYATPDHFSIRARVVRGKGASDLREYRPWHDLPRSVEWRNDLGGRRNLPTTLRRITGLRGRRPVLLCGKWRRRKGIDRTSRSK